MAALKFRINAEDFNNQMTAVLKKKAVGITTNNELYKTVSLNLVDYIRMKLINAGYYDTGALAFQSSGESEVTGYERVGHLPAPSKGRGIEWSAVEKTEKGDREYAEPAIGRALGMHEYITGASLQEALEVDGTWQSFLDSCKEPIIEAMRNAKG